MAAFSRQEGLVYSMFAGWVLKAFAEAVGVAADVDDGGRATVAHSTGRSWIESMVRAPASALVTTTIQSPGCTQPRRNR
jgi:hypothetical protein